MVAAVGGSDLCLCHWYRSLVTCFCSHWSVSLISVASHLFLQSLVAVPLVMFALLFRYQNKKWKTLRRSRVCSITHVIWNNSAIYNYYLLLFTRVRHLSTFIKMFASTSVSWHGQLYVPRTLTILGERAFAVSWGQARHCHQSIFNTVGLESVLW